MILKIKRSTIKAVSYAMAKKDLRKYLNGMLIHSNGCETRVIATDGARMNIAIVDCADSPVETPRKFIIPAEIVAAVCKCKTKKKNKNPEITFDFNGGKVSALLPDGTETVGLLVAGEYPNYNRVIPHTLSGDAAQYNPAFVLDAFAAASEYLDPNYQKSCMSMNGQGPGAVSCTGFAALIMPWRVTNMVSTLDARLLSPIASPDNDHG